MIFFNIKRGSWIYIRKISDATLIMQAGTIYLATILFLVQHIDFIITDLMVRVSTMGKYGQ